jgi:hypothetical protein
MRKILIALALLATAWACTSSPTAPKRQSKPSFGDYAVGTPEEQPIAAPSSGYTVGTPEEQATASPSSAYAVGTPEEQQVETP